MSFPLKKVEPADTVIIRNTPERTVVVHDTVQAPVPVIDVSKPFYAGIKTNLLYDIFLIPNIGIEFYLGKGWSLGGSWMYAWWKRTDATVTGAYMVGRSDYAGILLPMLLADFCPAITSVFMGRC